MSYILIEPLGGFTGSEFTLSGVGSFLSASITGLTKLKITDGIQQRPTATQVTVITTLGSYVINGTAKFKNGGSGLVKVGDTSIPVGVTVLNAGQTKCKSV